MFWLNGARILANDMPTWVAGLDNAEQLEITDEGRTIARQYAERALAFLEESREYQSDNPRMHIERGMIYWKKLDDVELLILRPPSVRVGLRISRIGYMATF